LPRARGCRRRRPGQPLRAGVSGTATSRTRAGTCLPDRTGRRPAGDRSRPDSSGARAAGRHPEVAPSEGSPGRTPRGSRRVPPDQQIRRPDGHRAGVPGEVSPEIKAPGTEAERVAYMHRGGAAMRIANGRPKGIGPPGEAIGARPAQSTGAPASEATPDRVVRRGIRNGLPLSLHLESPAACR
jgi:hypothetical protein